MIKALLLTLSALLASCGGNPFAGIRPDGYAFPAEFLWGVSVAAHQVEGGNDKNDWWDWEQKAGTIAHGDKSGDAVGFARSFKEDVGLAKGLSQNAFRLSIEWSRIEPEEGKRDAKQIRYYHDVLKALRDQGLRPFVTLFHFTTPRWVAAHGGWENERTIKDFAAFAGFCAREFGGEIDDWITLNEPNVYGYNSYAQGTWPPGKKDVVLAMRVIANQMIGHGAAAKELRADDPGCKVGIANHVILLEPFNALGPMDNLKAHFENQVFNEMSLDAVRTGRITGSIPGVGGVDVAAPDLVGSVDFVGINYYRRWMVTGSGPKDHDLLPGVATSDLGWEIYPDGLFKWLDRVRAQKLPIYVTENGVADKADATRPKYVVQHLMRVWQAIDAGIPVKGYFYWSLMDNFEWADGFSPRFGLFSVDYKKGNTSRTLTKGGEIYGRIARDNRLSADLIRSYGF